MASITSQLIVSLLDHVSGPAKGVGRAMSGMNQRIREINAGTVSMATRIDAAMQRNNQRMATYRAQAVDAAAMLYGLAKALSSPIEAAREFETSLTEIGNKSGMSAIELKALGQKAVAVGKQTNQYTKDILEGADILIGYGVSAEQASASLAHIGKAATATGASIRDMSELAYAALSNLMIPAEELPTLFDSLDKAGKEGGFELRDMAQYFPTLGAAMATAFNYKGTKAAIDLGAALQIVRRGAGSSAEAANNLQNVLQKINAPTTQKAFKKFGINVRKEVANGVKKGVSPVETFVRLTKEALKKGANLSELFTDKQVLEGMLPLLQYTEDYIALREKATNADGTVNQDFEKKMETNAEKTKAFQIALDDLQISIGNALLPTLTDLMEKITPFVDKLTKWTEEHPKLTKAITASVAGLFSFSAGLAILKWTLGFGFGGLLTLAKNLAVLSDALLLPGIVGLAGVGGVAAGLLLLATGVAAFAYVNWEEITSGWTAFWSKINVSDADKQKIDELIDRFNKLTGVDASKFKMEKGEGQGWGDWLGGQATEQIDLFIKDVDESMATLESYKKSINDGTVLNDLGEYYSTKFGQVADKMKGYGENIYAAAISVKDQMVKAGGELIQGIWDGMTAKWAEFSAWFHARAAELGNAFTGILPDWAKGTTSGPVAKAPNRAEVITGARARGGPISRGSSYWVGERGPELITAGRSGYVNKAGSAGGGQPVTVNQTVSFNITGTADNGTVEKIRKILRDEVRETFRGVFSDTGMRMA